MARVQASLGAAFAFLLPADHNTRCVWLCVRAMLLSHPCSPQRLTRSKSRQPCRHAAGGVVRGTTCRPGLPPPGYLPVHSKPLVAPSAPRGSSWRARCQAPSAQVLPGAPHPAPRRWAPPTSCQGNSSHTTRVSRPSAMRARSPLCASMSRTSLGSTYMTTPSNPSGLWYLQGGGVRGGVGAEVWRRFSASVLGVSAGRTAAARGRGVRTRAASRVPGRLPGWAGAGPACRPTCGSSG